MTNLNYNKDESNCILLAKVFDSPKTGCWKMKGKEKPTTGGPERKEERCSLHVRDRYLTLYYTIRNFFFSAFS